MARVRQAVPDDAEAIGAVHVSAWKYAYANILQKSWLEKQSVEERTKWWRAYIIEPESWPLFVLECDNRIVGLASVIPARDEDVDSSTVAEIASIYLLESASGKGLGSLLVNQCQTEALSRGYVSMILWVFCENEPALKFYRKHGFVTDSEPKYIAEFQTNEVRMRVNLICC